MEISLLVSRRGYSNLFSICSLSESFRLYLRFNLISFFGLQCLPFNPILIFTQYFSRLILNCVSNMDSFLSSLFNDINFFCMNSSIFLLNNFNSFCLTSDNWSIKTFSRGSLFNNHFVLLVLEFDNMLMNFWFFSLIANMDSLGLFFNNLALFILQCVSIHNGLFSLCIWNDLFGLS